MQAALSTLRDVEGVLGSFVLDQEGALLARDMPAMVDDKALQGAGRRLVRMSLALETLGRKPEQCSLRFGSFLLVARSADALTLCVLLSGTSNVTALHMGTTLVSRRVLSEHREAQAQGRMQALGELTVARAPSLPPPRPNTLPPPAKSRFLSPPTSASPEPAEGPDAPSPTRFFRGRPV